MGRIRTNPIVQLFLSHARELLRRPETLFWMYIVPPVGVLTLGLAFRSEPVEVVRVDFLDQPAAKSTRETLEADERFLVYIGAEDECRNRLRVNKCDLLIIVDDSDEPLEYVYDPTRPNSVLARNTANDVIQTTAGRKDIVASTDSEATDPGSRYVDFLVPGLMGVGIMGGGLWGIGFAVVDLRIRHLLKRLLATPMRRRDFLFAMMLSRLVFHAPEVILLILCANIFFGVVVHGSYFLLSALVVLGAVEFAAIGLLAASRSRTIEGVSGVLSFIMAPMWVGSGIFFSIDRFPEAVQPFLQILPLSPVVTSMRAVMLDGAGLTEILAPVAIMLAWSIGSFVLAMKIFRWR